MKTPRQTFYCVASTVYRDGNVEASFFGRDLEEKPKDTRMSKPEKDLSKNWFHTREEADAFYNQVKTPRPAVPLEKVPVHKCLLTPGEVAKMLAVSDKQVYRMAQNKEIPCHRVSCSIRFDPLDIEDYIFFSKGAPSNIQIRPSDAKELLQRIDERNDQEKAFLEGLIARIQKRRQPMRN